MLISWVKKLFQKEPIAVQKEPIAEPYFIWNPNEKSLHENYMMTLKCLKEMKEHKTVLGWRTQDLETVSFSDLLEYYCKHIEN